MAMRCTQWPTSAVGIGDVLGPQPAVDRLPRLAAVVGAERAGRRDGDEDPPGIARVEEDRVQAHAAGAGLPLRARAVAAQAGELLPGLPAVGGAEERGVLHAGVDGVGIGERRLEVPDALELPGVRRAVVPLVRAGDAVVDELVAHRLPGLAAVVGALDHLPEPAAGLRGVEPVRIDGRALEVIDLPAAEMRAVDVPLPARAVGGEDERALARADENANGRHEQAFPMLSPAEMFQVRTRQRFPGPFCPPISPRRKGLSQARMPNPRSSR